MQAAIFDMDGLLIDSEPLWREAEIAAFGKVGLTLTDADCAQTMGWHISEVIEFWYRKHPWTGATLQEVEDHMLELVESLIRERGQAMAGVDALLQRFQSNGVKLALASSSPMSLILAVLDKLNLTDVFPIVRSAQTETYGKPHPAVFLSTADELEVHPTECVVFEDSVNGTIAAKAARMKAVAVPDPEHFSDPRFGIADLKIPSLKHFSEKHWADFQLV